MIELNVASHTVNYLTLVTKQDFSLKNLQFDSIHREMNQVISCVQTFSGNFKKKLSHIGTHQTWHTRLIIQYISQGHHFNNGPIR